MDVAIVNRMLAINTGGAEIWDQYIARELNVRGWETTLYVGNPVFSDKTIELNGPQAVKVTTPTLHSIAYKFPGVVRGALFDLDKWLFSKLILKKIKNSSHDIVQVCNNQLFGKYAPSLDIPAVAVIHTSPFSVWYDGFRNISSYELLSKFDHIITVGGLEDELRDHVGTSISVVNPGVDTSHFSPSADTVAKSENVPVFLWVGRFVPAKNLSLLLSAFQTILSEGHDAQLWLVGSGPLENQIRRTIKELGLNNHVRFYGFVDHDQLPSIYSSADCFVLSSSSENNPIVLFEAMSCGTPVIAPDVGDIADIVPDRTCGYIFNPQSEAGLVKKLRSVLLDREALAEMGEKSREHATQNFDWRQSGEHVEEIYNEVIERFYD